MVKLNTLYKDSPYKALFCFISLTLLSTSHSSRRFFFFDYSQRCFMFKWDESTVKETIKYFELKTNTAFIWLQIDVEWFTQMCQGNVLEKRKIFNDSFACAKLFQC